MAKHLESPTEYTPPPGLDRASLRLWCETLAGYQDWLPHDLAILASACLAHAEIQTLTSELLDCTDFKKARQLRSDRNSATTTMRQCFRELNLATAPEDSRTPRILGRYA